MKNKTTPHVLTDEQERILLNQAKQDGKDGRKPIVKVGIETPAQKMGKILKKIRKIKGFTQRDVANEYGLTSPNFIGEIERGQSKPPKNRISEFIAAYDADARLKDPLLKTYYPEIWTFIFNKLYDDFRGKHLDYDPIEYDHGLDIKINKGEVDSTWL